MAQAFLVAEVRPWRITYESAARADDQCVMITRRNVVVHGVVGSAVLDYEIETALDVKATAVIIGGVALDPTLVQEDVNARACEVAGDSVARDDTLVVNVNAVDRVAARRAAADVTEIAERESIAGVGTRSGRADDRSRTHLDAVAVIEARGAADERAAFIGKNPDRLVAPSLAIAHEGSRRRHDAALFVVVRRAIQHRERFDETAGNAHARVSVSVAAPNDRTCPRGDAMTAIHAADAIVYLNAVAGGDAVLPVGLGNAVRDLTVCINDHAARAIVANCQVFELRSARLSEIDAIITPTTDRPVTNHKIMVVGAVDAVQRPRDSHQRPAAQVQSHVVGGNRNAVLARHAGQICGDIVRTRRGDRVRKRNDQPTRLNLLERFHHHLRRTRRIQWPAATQGGRKVANGCEQPDYDAATQTV